MELQQVLKMSSTNLHILSQPLPKTRGQLCSAENFLNFTAF